MNRTYSGDITGVLGLHQDIFLLEDYGATIQDIRCWKVCGCMAQGGTYCHGCFASEEDHRNIMIQPLRNSLLGHTIGGIYSISRHDFERYSVHWIRRNRAYVERYILDVIPEDNGSILYHVRWAEELPQQPWFHKVLEDYRLISQIGYFFQVRHADICVFQLMY